MIETRGSPAAGPSTPDRRLYVVATVHLDTQWRWTIQDTIRDFLPATLRQNFSLLERFPFFVVSFEGAFRYMLMQEYYPAEFERLKHWVARGRWRVAGSMLEAPDVNMVSPESLIRHVLYGNGFFQRELGCRSHDLFLPDCFGFGFALPSIAAHCGLAGFSSQKFGNWMGPASIPFDLGIWQGPDGASVIAALRPEGYGEGLAEDLSQATRWLERIDATGVRTGAYVALMYVGVGDRGGSLDERSMEWLDRSVRGKGPVRILVTGSDQLFQDLVPQQAAKLPRHRGELLLPTHGSGCLTSQAVMKRWNRRNETLGDAAERAAVMADWLGVARYPKARLRDAWTRFLWHQMHDDLAGTSIPAAYRFSHNDQLISLNQFASVLTHSLTAIAAGMDTRCQGQAIVVFNPLSIERQDPVEVILPAPPQATDSVRVCGPNDEEIPAQLSAIDRQRVQVVFLARLPALAAAVFDVRLGSPSCRDDGSLRAAADGLESSRYRVEIDAAGDVARLVDLTLNLDLLSAPIGLELLSDRSSRWPAWEVRFEDLNRIATRVGGPAETRLIERGPARVSLEITRQAKGSSFRQLLRLYGGEAAERFEIANEVLWRTPGRMLKVSFPLSSSSPTALYDLGLGCIERGNNRREKYEVPAQQWADLSSSDQGFGVSILNDCKYGWDKPADQTLRLTLLRSPRVRRRFRHQGRQDFGRHLFTFALYGHGDSWTPEDSSWQATRLNQPLLPFRTVSHPGTLGRVVSLLGSPGRECMLKALKIADEGDALIARVQELAGRERKDARLRFATPLVSAREVDGCERQLGLAALSGGDLAFALDPFALKTFALELTPADSPGRPVPGLPVSLPFDLVATSRQGETCGTGLDGCGHAIPAELFPQRIEFGGVDFELGPSAAGMANALTCRGQTIDLQPGAFDSLHLLAVSAAAQSRGVFRAEGREIELEIPCYTGFIGEWRRAGRWRRRTPTVRLGDRQPVAWLATHRHDADGRDEPYVYCYLFAFTLELPPRCSALQLPDAPVIKIFAMTQASNRSSGTQPAAPLYQ